MTKTEPEVSGTRIMGSVQDAERAALEAVRKFVDTVDSALPAVGGSGEDSPRSKIIDSAFTMVENLVGSSNQFAENILQTASRAVDQSSSSDKDN